MAGELLNIPQATTCLHNPLEVVQCAVDREVAAKYAELLEENASLRGELSEIRTSQREVFKGGEDSAAFVLGIYKANNQGAPDKVDSRIVCVTWVEIFRATAESIILGTGTEQVISKEIATRLAGPLDADQLGRWAHHRGVAQIKMRLFGLPLVDFETYVGGTSFAFGKGMHHRWRLTSASTPMAVPTQISAAPEVRRPGGSYRHPQRALKGELARLGHRAVLSQRPVCGHPGA